MTIALHPFADLLYSLASSELDERGYTDNAGYILALALDNIGDVATEEQPSCFIGTIESCCCDSKMTDEERTILLAINEVLFARYKSAQACGTL